MDRDPRRRNQDPPRRGRQALGRDGRFRHQVAQAPQEEGIGRHPRLTPRPERQGVHRRRDRPDKRHREPAERHTPQQGEGDDGLAQGHGKRRQRWIQERERPLGEPRGGSPEDDGGRRQVHNLHLRPEGRVQAPPGGAIAPLQEGQTRQREPQAHRKGKVRTRAARKSHPQAPARASRVRHPRGAAPAQGCDEG